MVGPSPARHPVQADPGDAEHACTDGDSWRHGGDHEVIVHALTCNCFGDAEGRGGVPGTQPRPLCAIMEGTTTGGR